MSIPGKVLVALLCAACVSAIWATYIADIALLSLFAPCAVAALLAVALSHRALPVPSAIDSAAQTDTASAKPANAASAQKSRSNKEPRNKEPLPKGRHDKKSGPQNGDKAKRAKSAKTETTAGPKESGTVKWFNGTKGFGFIIRESGEEIFVHHRSIEGDGRRSLRDGAAVRFRVVDTDKGPQAENVEAEA